MPFLTNTGEKLCFNEIALKMIKQVYKKKKNMESNPACCFLDLGWNVCQRDT